jgi:hypothetical protein
MEDAGCSASIYYIYDVIEYRGRPCLKINLNIEIEQKKQPTLSI